MTLADVCDIDISDIQLYAPELDEELRIDYQKYRQMLGEDFNKTIELYRTLRQKVLGSPVKEGITFSDYLFGPNGYFSRNPSVSEIIIIGGRFKFSISSGKDKGELASKVMHELAEQQNAIPFSFKPHPNLQRGIS